MTGARRSAMATGRRRGRGAARTPAAAAAVRTEPAPRDDHCSYVNQHQFY